MLSVHRIMYWTNYEGFIGQGSMNGSNKSLLVTGLYYPAGIVIDWSSRRLFWVEYKGDVVRSCDLNGGDIQTVVELPSGSYPWGITIHEDRVYWGHYWAYSLHSSSKNGGAIETLYTGTHKIQHLTVATPSLQLNST